jgi:hypothetical protein
MTACVFERDGEIVRVDPSGPLIVRIGTATDLALDLALTGTGIIHLFEDWLRPHLARRLHQHAFFIPPAPRQRRAVTMSRLSTSRRHFWATVRRRCSEQTGVRVPAFVISPSVDPGTVFSQPLDHTPMLQLIADRFGQGFYSAAVVERPPRIAEIEAVQNSDVLAAHLGAFMREDRSDRRGGW